MNRWEVHLKWTGVTHEKVSVEADTKEKAEALIKNRLASNEWSIFDHAWEEVEGWDESEVEIVYPVLEIVSLKEG